MKPCTTFRRSGLFAALFFAFTVGGGMLLDRLSGTAPVLQFSLTDQTGRRVTERDFAGLPKLVFFGFTGCSNICPLTLERLGDVQNAPDFHGQKLKILFVTLDPFHDTPDALAQYLKNFPSDIVGLTGERRELQPLYDAFRVYAGDFGGAKKAPASDHSGFVYLVDGSGRIRSRFTADTSLARMVDLITSSTSSDKKQERKT